MCITKSDSYYKTRQKTVIAKYVKYNKGGGLLLINASSFANCDSYYRVAHNRCCYSYHGL